MKEPDDITLRVYHRPDTQKGPGPESAGQSGDDMGLSTDETSSESVAELVDEGQYFEAEALSGLERPYPDEEEVRTREVLEDDVPTEYPAKDSVETD
jgi:hypothetical protein